MSSSFATISPSSLSYGRNFSVDSSGKLNATDATITGDINATSIYAKDTYNIYVDGKNKASKVIWCDTNEYEWNPSAGYADLYMGHDGKAWMEFLDSSYSNYKFIRKSIMASQYFNTSNRQNNYSSVNCVTDQDTTYIEFTTIRNDIPASVRLQIANDSGLCFIPGDVNDSALTYDETIKLGTKSHKWMQVWTKNLYANGDTVRFSGISAKSSTRYLVIDDNGNVGYRDGNNTEGGNASSYDSLTNKPQINGHTLVSGNNTLSNLGIASRSHSHSSSDINWSTTLGWQGFGHNHTMIYDGNGKKAIAIAGSGSNTGLIPYDVSYNNADNISFTRGGTMYLGAAYYSNKLTAYPFECGYFKNIKVYKGSGDASDISNYITPSGGGSSLTGGLTIQLDGTPKISSWKGASDASVNITASSIGAATTSWVEEAFGSRIDVSNGYLYLYNNNGSQLSSVQLPTSSGGGGTTYSAGSGISISGDTISVDYNDLYVHKIYHSDTSYYAEVRSNGNSRYFGCNYDQSLNLGDTSCKWKNIWGKNGNITGSDEELKTQMSKINDIPNIESIYMKLNPIKYKYKNFDSEEDHDRFHFGFGARETEKIFNDNNLDTSDYGLICKDILLKPNKAGNIVEYALRYGEFIALNTHMTQKAHHRIDSLSQENQKLKNIILSLQGEIAIIKQKLEELA